MNRVVIVTGSSRGIGEATAAKFLEDSDKVVVFCQHKEHVAEARERLNKIGRPENILATAGDVRKARDVKRIVDESMEKFGRVDVLVNNAGVALWKLIEETSEKEWDEVLDTNLKGYFLFIREVVPFMKKQKHGIIINISSGLGRAGEAKYAAYSASKFGIIGLGQVVADETKDYGIKVYNVLPGAVATKLHLDIHPWEDPAKMMTPEYVAAQIFKLADGREETGASIEIYR